MLSNHLFFSSQYYFISSLGYSQPNFWQQTNGPFGENITSLAINGAGHIFAGTVYSGVFRSTVNGDNWNEINTGLTNPHVFALAINGDGHIFAGTFDGVFRSTDNGDTWSEINAGLTNTFIFALAVNRNDVLFAGTGSGTRNGVPVFGSVFRSTDNGEHWTEISSGLDSSSVWSLAINDSNDIFAGTAGGVFRSTDNGDTWSEINTGLTGGNIMALPSMKTAKSSPDIWVMACFVPPTMATPGMKSMQE
jgi:photosystem II stability/assembly factor-like uncharacterized protein